MGTAVGVAVAKLLEAIEGNYHTGKREEQSRSLKTPSDLPSEACYAPLSSPINFLPFVPLELWCPDEVPVADAQFAAGDHRLYLVRLIPLGVSVQEDEIGTTHMASGFVNSSI